MFFVTCADYETTYKCAAGTATVVGEGWQVDELGSNSVLLLNWHQII